MNCYGNLWHTMESPWSTSTLSRTFIRTCNAECFTTDVHKKHSRCSLGWNKAACFPLSSSYYASTGSWNKQSTIETGIQWSLTEHLEDLDVADDIALLSHTHQQIQEKSKLLELGLKINGPKTKIMRINNKSMNPITALGQAPEEVDQFTGKCNCCGWWDMMGGCEDKNREL